MFSLFTTMLQRESQMEAEKVQAEMGREKAEESSRAKSVFLSNMSYDIRTPMNAIIGYTDIARRAGTSKAEMREYLDKISSSSQHLLALINAELSIPFLITPGQGIGASLHGCLPGLRYMYRWNGIVLDHVFTWIGNLLLLPLFHFGWRQGRSTDT